LVELFGAGGCHLKSMAGIGSSGILIFSYSLTGGAEVGITGIGVSAISKFMNQMSSATVLLAASLIPTSILNVPGLKLLRQLVSITTALLFTETQPCFTRSSLVLMLCLVLETE